MDSVGKSLAMQSLGSEFECPAPYEKLDLVAHVYNSSPGCQWR